jgi:LysM repeat protein
MNRKDSPQSVIDSYRRRQQMTPVIMAVLAILLVIAGIIILLLWFRGNGGGLVGAMESTPTASATVEAAATSTTAPPTATVTETATITLSPTITETATPSGPFEYEVKSGDICWDIAANNKVDVEVLLAINGFEPGTCPIQPGDKILIPLPDTKLPTETAIPATMSGKLEYSIKTGETLADIASKFNSTVDAILKENKTITNVNEITAGQKITIPVNIVTPTPTKAATATNTPGGPTETATQPAATEAATATPTPQP